MGCFFAGAIKLFKQIDVWIKTTCADCTKIMVTNKSFACFAKPLKANSF